MDYHYRSKSLRTCHDRGYAAFLAGRTDCPYVCNESRSGVPRPGPQIYAWVDGNEEARRDAKAEEVVDRVSEFFDPVNVGGKTKEPFR